MATFECETNEPFVKVKWLKDNCEIVSGDKYRMHSDRKAHMLSVLMLDTRDDGEYSCEVVDDQLVRTSGKLNVEGGLPRGESPPVYASCIFWHRPCGIGSFRGTALKKATRCQNLAAGLA